jgi:hypothetical protein
VIAPGNSTTASDAARHGASAPAMQAGNDDRLPSFWGFAAIAAIANAPVVGLLLLCASIKPAFSVGVGLATGLLVYATLHLFINRGLDFFLVGVRSQAPSDSLPFREGAGVGQSGGSAVLIAMLLPLKYVVIGAALYWLVNAHAVDVPWVAVGFMITQIAVTVSAMKRLRSMPLV